MSVFLKAHRVFIIAEVSANHGQNFNRAVVMLRKANECGADAVKFQCYTPDALTINCDNKYFRIKHSTWRGQTLYQLYQKAYTPWKWFKKLKRIADDLGIIFFATAFDRASVDFLEELNVPFHKISSFEFIDLPLIEYVSKTKKPLILSAGMATLPEIKEAIDTARKAGAKEAILLKCVSSYPARPDQMNLRTIPDLKKRFRVSVGLSDHTSGIGVSVAAVSLGAQVIEKHFTLSKKIETPDGFFSIEPRELRLLVENVRVVERSLGKVQYGVTPNENKSRILRRSLFAVEDIKAGEFFTEKNIRSIRPGYGMPPKLYQQLMSNRASQDISRGTPLTIELVSKERWRELI